MSRKPYQLLTYIQAGDLGEDIEVLVTYNFTPADPGNISGPPENCWEPMAAEVEILSAIVQAPDHVLDKQDIHRSLTAEAIAGIELQAIDERSVPEDC